MAEIVNLNRRRKQAAREAEARQAAANREKFGRTRAERARDAEAEARRNALLDGARREGNPPGESGAGQDGGTVERDGPA